MAQQLAPVRTVGPAPPLPLEGWDVVVTSARRGRDLVALLRHQGARVQHVPAVRTVPLDDDAGRLEATTRALDGSVDVVVATTGVGFTTWLDAADGWGLGERLRKSLEAAQVFARGPKARGALLTAGLYDAAAVPCDSSWEVLEQLLAQDLEGRRVLVQLHGAAIDDFSRILRTAGAEVVEIPVYRSLPPEDDEGLVQLARRIAAREVQAVTFTSAAAATNLLDVAERLGLLDDVLDALANGVQAGCVGPVSAAPLVRLSAPVVLPAQARLGALAHALGRALEQAETRLLVAGHELTVRGTGIVVDGAFRGLAPGPMAILRRLVERPGQVVAPDVLAAALPGGGDSRAVEMTVSRLRAAVGVPDCVRNVVKRGYLLAVEGVVDDESGPGEEPVVPVEPLLTTVGGTAAVRAAVERLYARLLADPLVSHFFADVDMPRLKRHQVLLLSELLGGPARYTGRELGHAHAGLGITAQHYACVLDHLVAVLEELAVDPAAVQVVVGALREAEPAVTGR